MGFFMSDINFCNTKEQLNHLGEVVTGKVDGSPTGADIDTSTLPYTGQVRKTLPALEGEYEQSITNKEAEADAAIDSYRLLNKGAYASGITLESKFEYITYNGEAYFATTPPYTTTATTPDADGNLFIGGYISQASISAYTDLVYKSSGGNSAFENMVAGIPVISSIGETVGCEFGSKFKRVANSGGPSDFSRVGELYIQDFGNNTENIKTALTFGGVLNLEYGADYLITEELNANIDGTVIAAYGARLYTDSAATHKILRLTGKDCKLLYGESHQDSENILAAVTLEGEGCLVRGTLFTDNCEYSCVVEASSYDTTIELCTFEKTNPASFNVVCQGSKSLIEKNTMNGGDAGVVVNEDPKFVTVRDNDISNQTEIGVDVIGRTSEEVTIEKNRIKTCALGAIRVGTPQAGGYYGKGVNVLYNYTEDCGSNFASCIAITGDGSGADQEITVTGNRNIGSDNSNAGIIVTNCYNPQILGNRNKNCDKGIWLNDGAKNATIEGNYCYENRESGIYGDLAALDVDAFANITNNYCYNNGETVGSGKGISLRIAKHVNVKNNYIYCDNTLQGIGLHLQANTGGGSIEANTIYGNTSDQILIDSPRTSADYSFGDNWDDSNNNLTRYISAVGFGASSSVQVSTTLIANPRVVNHSVNTNNFVWISSYDKATLTFNRESTVNDGTVIRFEAKI